MRHSLLAPGKRIRPMVTIMVTAHMGGREELALDPACAVEMVHTASLILDDLPLMDNATLRRGRPANHRIYGEDTAMLAAVALLNGAYAVIAEARHLSAALRAELISVLANAIGSDGIVAGQESDLHADHSLTDFNSLLQRHAQKTAALFVAAADIGARIAGTADDRLHAVREFAHNLGLAFQIRDDVIDIAGDHGMGKDTGQDANKTTFASLVGGERALALAGRYADQANFALRDLGPALAPLAELTRTLVESDQNERTRFEPEFARAAS